MTKATATALAALIVVGVVSDFAPAQRRRGNTDSSTPRAAAPSGASAAAPAKADYRERYAMLGDYNIFIRERQRRGPENEGPSSRPAPTSQPYEKSFTLVGITSEEGGFTAYVEDANRGRVLKLAIGDSIARGRIANLTIDSLAYEAEGKLAWIDVGRDFTGGIALPISPSGTTDPSVPGAAGTPTLDPNDPSLTLEQRMKLRRQLGQ